MNAIGPLAKKSSESSVFIKRSDWIILFQVSAAGSSCRTVKELLAFLFLKVGSMNEIMNWTSSCTNLATHLTCWACSCAWIYKKDKLDDMIRILSKSPSCNEHRFKSGVVVRYVCGAKIPIVWTWSNAVKQQQFFNNYFLFIVVQNGVRFCCTVLTGDINPIWLRQMFRVKSKDISQR